MPTSSGLHQTQHADPQTQDDRLRFLELDLVRYACIGPAGHDEPPRACVPGLLQALRCISCQFDVHGPQQKKQAPQAAEVLRLGATPQFILQPHCPTPIRTPPRQCDILRECFY